MAIAVIAAVITPSGDPVTMAMLGVPMVVLYFLAILLGWLVVQSPPGRHMSPAADRARTQGRVRRPVLRSPSTGSRPSPSTRSTVASTSWSPYRPAAARPWSPSTASPLRRHDGKRAFYTAPVKALSNQKYRDLVAMHGEDDVGLLTGDNSINGDAPIVVMTTEVLRNMIYGRSRLLHDLGLVVLDEVHFLQDSYRGPVWEEVMIHLPQHVRLVCLSATVSNVDELAEWITTVRGPTASIVERRRPVRLDNEYLVADRTNDRLRMLPVFVDGHLNRDAIQLDESAVRGRPRRGDHQSRHRNDKGSGRKVLAPPNRVETVELLERRRLLPAIYFIFSRAQCDAAAKACVDAGLDLVDAGERTAIRTIIDARLGGLDDADLDVLGFRQFVAQLECGVAAHHAGMVPPMKEVVEACFVEGLVKVVFATETLAVGINMPARTVVIEKLTKFTGEHHERLTPGQYTQLTGRAGRRGIDDLGTAVVLWSPWVRFDEVAELAGSSSFHLRSAFRPTYNMAANLVRTYSNDEAHRLLNLSFAQYQADRDVVRLEARLERRRVAAAELRATAHSELGDIDEYRRLRAREQDERTAGRADQLREVDRGHGLDASRIGGTRREGHLQGTSGGGGQREPQGWSPAHAGDEVGEDGVPHRRRLQRTTAAAREHSAALDVCAEPKGLPQRRRSPLAQL